MVSGFLAALLAIFLLTGALYFLQNELTGFIRILDWSVLLIVYSAVLALGISLSVLATVIAVNKYLRTDGDTLYYM
jgi:cell division transport system permease protein